MSQKGEIERVEETQEKIKKSSKTHIGSKLDIQEKR